MKVLPLGVVVVVLVDSPDRGIVAYDPSAADRLRSRLLAVRSDRRLAQGVPPEQDVYLALRAQQLVSSKTRRWLASSLRRLLDEARRPARLAPGPFTPECRRRLVEADEAVNRLIADLQRPAPVSSRGMAALCMLLRDGTGPLYGAGSPRELRECLGQVEGQLLPPSIW